MRHQTIGHEHSVETAQVAGLKSVCTVVRIAFLYEVGTVGFVSMTGLARFFDRNALKEPLSRGSIEDRVFVPHALQIRVFSKALIYGARFIVEGMVGVAIAVGQLLYDPSIFLSYPLGTLSDRLANLSKSRLINGFRIINLLSQAGAHGVEMFNLLLNLCIRWRAVVWLRVVVRAGQKQKRDRYDYEHACDSQYTGWSRAIC